MEGVGGKQKQETKKNTNNLPFVMYENEYEYACMYVCRGDGVVDKKNKDDATAEPPLLSLFHFRSLSYFLSFFLLF
jgi:hypothetical protein